MKGYAYTLIPIERLRQIVNAPDDAQIVGADMDYATGAVRVYLIGDSLPKVPECGQPLLLWFVGDAPENTDGRPPAIRMKGINSSLTG